MDLDDKDIQEFMRLWQEEFKETISAADARHSASQLLELYAILARPLPEEGPHTNSNNVVPPCDTFSTAENPAKMKTDKSSP
jgi:hypothetical protein